MMKLIMALYVTMFSLSVFAHDSGKVSLAKVAELSAHRADRLVALGKIDAGFVQKLEKIEVLKLENAAPASYKVIVSQTQPAQGNPLQIELLFDHDGKALSFKAVPGGIAGVDPKWGSKDAGTLAENAMHYVLENSTSNMVAPYANGLPSLTLKKTLLNGQVVAVGIISTSLQAQKLHIYLNLDGTLLSAEVLP